MKIASTYSMLVLAYLVLTSEAFKVFSLSGELYGSRRSRPTRAVGPPNKAPSNQASEEDAATKEGDGVVSTQVVPADGQRGGGKVDVDFVTA